MSRILALALTFSLLSCANQKNINEIVLDYSDFGPQVIAYEIIGMEWWQWNDHGNSRPTEYDIRVVVYKNINAEEIKKRYPVIIEKKQDYRYLKYQDAIKYLNSKIEEDAMPSVTTLLRNTLKKLNMVFDESKS